MSSTGGGFDHEMKPALAMFGLQFSYACVALSTRAALLRGMNPRVFVVYRQTIATLAIAPFAFFSSRGKSNGSPLGLKSFCLIFTASLIGVTINQNMYFEGLYLASSSIASAMGNLVPAVTFILAMLFGLEKVNLRSLGSLAKVAGTMICVGGAISMALLRGPKLLNAEQGVFTEHVVGSEGGNWLVGCLFLFGSSCCWSIWLILQVPVTSSYPNHLSVSAWMCFVGALQSSVVTFFLEPDPQAWIIQSRLELACCLFAGIIGSGLSFYVQAWCISRRGPVFSAMFNPLATVIVTIFAALFLREEIYIGKFKLFFDTMWALGVIIGLYTVLWGKAKDTTDKDAADTKASRPGVKLMKDDQNRNVQILIDEFGAANNICRKVDLDEPLLVDYKI